MTKAKRSSTTFRGQNVIVLRPTMSLTSADTQKARREMHRLPEGWFEVSLTKEIDLNGPQNYLTVERVAGPPVGWFTIARHGRSGYVVEGMGEEGSYAGEGPQWRVSTLADAVQAIRNHVDEFLASWGVSVAA